MVKHGKMKAATYLVVDENLEMKRSVVERSPSQVAVSPSVLPQGHLYDDQTTHTRAKVSLFFSHGPSCQSQLTTQKKIPF